MKSARPKATYEQLRNVPDPLVAEIIDGDLVTTPRPAVPHALAASAIGSVLFGAFNGPPGGSSAPGGWWILYEPELHLGEDVLVPDIAGWRRTRMPTLPNAPALTDAPDWACEIVSPSTVGIDRGRKMRIYARERIGHLWMVEPTAHLLEVYRLDGDRWILVTTHEGSGRVRVEPFADVEIDVARWWREP